MKSFIVTTSWDDGHKLDLKLASLLKKYNVKGTFYISPFYLTKLKEEEMKVLSFYNEIGAHTLTHVDLNSIPINEAEKEIGGSKFYLEKLLGHEINMFCYPHGRYNRRVKEIVKNYGFLGARTCNYGGFELPKHPFEWSITLHASNGSPLVTMKILLKSKIPIKAILDWDVRANLLFDSFLSKGGIYHLWGHSWEINKNKDWSKLEQVLQYISDRPNVEYMTNGETLRRYS